MAAANCVSRSRSRAVAMVNNVVVRSSPIGARFGSRGKKCSSRAVVPKAPVGMPSTTSSQCQPICPVRSCTRSAEFQVKRSR